MLVHIYIYIFQNYSMGVRLGGGGESLIYFFLIILCKILFVVFLVAQSEPIGITFSGNKNLVMAKLNLHNFGKCTLFYVATYE